MSYNVGDIVNGQICRVEKYGIFINVSEDIMFCHISELSSKYIKNISERYKVGDIVNAKIILLEDNKHNVSIKSLESVNKNNTLLNHKKNNYKFNDKNKTDFNTLLDNFLKQSNEKFKDIESKNKKRRK